MLNIIDSRNWAKVGRQVALAVDQNMGPHNGGCGTCTGLITVHNGDGRSGQVDFNIDTYDMGQADEVREAGRVSHRLHGHASVPTWRGSTRRSKALVALQTPPVRPRPCA